MPICKTHTAMDALGCNMCFQEAQAENIKLRAQVEKIKDAYAVSQNDLIGANLELHGLRKLCGEAADVVHLSELPSPDKMKLYSMLASAANGLEKKFAICGWCAGTGKEERTDVTCPKCNGLGGRVA